MLEEERQRELKARSLVHMLRRQGIALTHTLDGKLNCHAPPGVLAEYRQQLGDLKPEIFLFLDTEPLERKILSIVTQLEHPTPRMVAQRLHLPSVQIRDLLEHLVLLGLIDRRPIKQGSYRYSVRQEDVSDNV
ncbi:hypothetical protein KDI_04320 [Dictyobacter arantiisoli]|uniref:TubC N-terminal docking domain-containing protein n=1 Tax=Dictyobacter arantiisoli TaxID=2014874 RepID=A0A5A5T677_9CHLR|nr:hypothetical protein KDI_04320 [Dictyobacter arantiisoli]